MEKIYQNAIECLNTLAQESLDVKYIDKAIEYAEWVEEICTNNKTTTANEHILMKSSDQIESLKILRVDIERDAKINKLEK